MTIIGVMGKASSTQDQVTLDRACDPDFHAKLIRGVRFTLR